MIIEDGGYVCGVILDKGLNVEHLLTNNKNDIKAMKGSKYVQSNLKNCYANIKKMLELNKSVLFSGTPCQVAGLRLFLRKDYLNLFCVDIVCHGVPSPTFFKKHIYKNYGTIDSLKFREKNKFEGSEYKFVLKQKNHKTKEIYATDDPYYSAFILGKSFRECCYNCEYTKLQRVGDITIGDCGNMKLYNSFSYGEVASSVFINSEKGYFLWDKIKNKLNFQDAELKKEVEKNKQLRVPMERKKERDEIYLDFNQLSVKDFSKKYKIGTNFKNKIKRKIRRIIPLTYKEKIKKILMKG